jgi:hypothetical protein
MLDRTTPNIFEPTSVPFDPLVVKGLSLGKAAVLVRASQRRACQQRASVVVRRRRREVGLSTASRFLVGRDLDAGARWLARVCASQTR